MKVWKLLSPKVIAEEERPDSIASPTQAKVKIAKVLIAYPEIRAYTGAAGIRYPRVPGMYAIGVVVEAGEGCVKVEKNTRVFLDGVAPCGVDHAGPLERRRQVGADGDDPSLFDQNSSPFDHP